MWWPAIGGLVDRHRRLVLPQALGVGYDTIGELLQGDVAGESSSASCRQALIWVGLARIGDVGRRARAAADDGRRARRRRGDVSSELGAGFWPLVSMGAILGGDDAIAVYRGGVSRRADARREHAAAAARRGTLAHTFTVLVLKRSILTEKLARRGYHLSREYAIDPLEILFVRDVMSSKPGDSVVPAGLPCALPDEPLRRHRPPHGERRAHAVRRDRPLRYAPGDRVGHSEDLLKARSLNLEAEHVRERTMRVRDALPFLNRLSSRVTG
jgi:hypothetical protein